MILIPAIDLKDGQAVRLYKGDYQQKTVYSTSPIDIALEFENMGADYLHVVDLDGAKDGKTTNLKTIQKIKESLSIPVELGGGIRDMKTVDLYLSQIGIDRVILGTAAIENPEFLKEGDAVNDFMRPDRVVIGVESARAEKVMERLYHAFVLNNTPIYFMDIPSAEMTKYAANSMLATRISFMNDIANLCEIVGADIEAVKKGIGSDTRIGKKFLNAGCGYGGSCFPKDVKALIRTGDEYGYGMELLKAVERVNERQKTVLFDKIQKHYEGNVKGKHFGLWGLSFKPATDDMREAPSLVLIGQLLEAGATVKAFDPVAMEEAKRRLGDRIGYAANMYDALTDADAMIIVTEWQEFKVPKFTFIEKALKEKVIFDGRNIYNPEQMREFGYTYYGIGKNR